MSDQLIHLRVPKKLKEELDRLVKEGYFSTQSEVIKEGIRHLILKYKNEK
ncbi:MAG: ribbon-helix-helix protein, CopG family [Methanobacteriota archaeon]|jgi:Arc/MetJ-type ribon-helix-helix transcriptional regulator|nr:MAG: ribbon-helix-helix protein, CopG family [Euryarchaeota archaeon]